MKIDFSLKSKQMLVGVVLSIIAFTLCCAAGGSLMKSAVLSCGFLVISIVKVHISQRARPLVLLGVFAVSGVAALWLTQFVQGEGIGLLDGSTLISGILFCGLLNCILFLVWPNIWFSTVVSVGAAMLLSTANYFVFQFRGSELAPADLLAVGTALNVAGGYSFSVIPNIIYGWVIFCLLVAALWILDIPKIGRKNREYIFWAGLTLCVCVVFEMGSRNVITLHFQNGGTVHNGYILNFVLSVRESFLTAPEGYRQGDTEELIQSYIKEQNDATSSPKETDIIVIMDEAYSDLGVLGERFDLTAEVSPFVHNLSENTIKGYALTSAFGGRTANSEYEFLTGSSMAFAPQGAIAYQQFVTENSFSMASVLQEKEYDTLAMHPYIANGWMRDSVWPKLGFEQCLFLEDFKQTDLLRGLVSDREMAEKIIEVYENRTESDPLFLFGVTMQNHSPFDYSGEDFESTVLLDGYEGEYPDAEQYLALLKETDRAVERLITYFSQVERDTVIVFFGDHLPALDQRLYEEIHGGTFDNLDEQMQQYKIPFFVWANYDIPEQEVECTSLNYLATLVYETAGIQLTPYHLFLKEMEQEIPSMNLNGYFSGEQGRYLPVGDATGEEERWLQLYHALQYEYMKGKGNPEFYLG